MQSSRWVQCLVCIVVQHVLCRVPFQFSDLAGALRRCPCYLVLLHERDSRDCAWLLGLRVGRVFAGISA